MLGRNVNHMAGRDIVLCMQKADVHRAMEHNLSDFFVGYIPTARELRVHVFGDDVLKMSEKVLTNLEMFRHPWVRNFDNGYTFRNPRPMTDLLKTNVSAQAIGAVQALGLVHGAVDVIVGDNSQAYALEVNTGPSLGDNTLEVYARKFGEELGITPDIPEVPNEDQDFEEML